MATSEGASIVGPQVLINGLPGDTNNVFILLLSARPVRPVRIGYFWYGFSFTSGQVDYGYQQGVLSSWGLSFPRAIERHPGGVNDTLVIDWNVAGVPWFVTW